jgi:hypothetical protein
MHFLRLHGTRIHNHTIVAGLLRQPGLKIVIELFVGTVP